MEVNFGNIIDELNKETTRIAVIKNDVLAIKRAVNKELKRTHKQVEKQKTKHLNLRKPSGFALPTEVSDKLCDFMKVESGTKLARTEVTRYIINYIKTNGLQNKENKRNIQPDNVLQELLETEDGEEISYFSLQKHMNKHFSASS